MSDQPETWFMAAFGEAGMGMAFIDGDGVIMESNAALREMTGYSAAELSEIGVEGITHPDDLHGDQLGFREPAEGRPGRHQLEKRYVTRDGRVIRGKLTVVALPGTGERRLFLGMVEDITRHREAEEELSRALDLFRVVADYTYDWEWLDDADGNLLWTSPSCERVTGHPPEAFMADRGLL